MKKDYGAVSWPREPWKDDPILCMRHLKTKHGLHFTHNPGGGEFWRDGLGRLQIGCEDDSADCGALWEWLIGLGLEGDGEPIGFGGHE